MGYSVLLSNYRRYFSLASYLSTFSKESIVISMGIPSVRVRQLLLLVMGVSIRVVVSGASVGARADAAS